MIREVVAITKENVLAKVVPYMPPAISVEKHCAITIHNPQKQVTYYPNWVRPILRLNHESSETNAEKIMVFLDSIEQSKSPFLVFVNDDARGEKVISIVKIIKAIRPSITVRQELFTSKTPEDHQFSRVLAKVYGQQVAKALHSAQVGNDG